jgi:hypothetical protein
MLCRWTGDALDAQLKPRFWELCPPELLKEVKAWHADEEYVELANGSRLYVRALKSSDESSRYAKTAGLTLAFIIIDQPEEVPQDVYEYLKGRLSQKGYPQQIILLPNPPEHDHWISKEFPEDNSKANHEYIHFSTYDNRENLGEDYIKALEEAYPPTHPMHRRLLLGKRGVTTLGKPVYGRVFKSAIHMGDVRPDPTMPILASYDFAFHHPAVSWHQITATGQWKILGELQGADQYLEDFIPMVLAQQAKYVVPGQSVWITCDPSGANPTSHATKKTAVTILQENGIYATIVPSANRPEVREYAVDHIARLFLRLTPDGPAITVDTSCRIFADGFMAGYVYPEKLVRGKRVPLKDGYYDNLQNTLEYAVLAFLLPAQDRLTAVMPQEEFDEDEIHERHQRARLTGRAGY